MYHKLIKRIIESVIVKDKGYYDLISKGYLVYKYIYIQ